MLNWMQLYFPPFICIHSRWLMNSIRLVLFIIVALLIVLSLTWTMWIQCICTFGAVMAFLFFGRRWIWFSRREVNWVHFICVFFCRSHFVNRRRFMGWRWRKWDGVHFVTFGLLGFVGYRRRLILLRWRYIQGLILCHHNTILNTQPALFSL